MTLTQHLMERIDKMVLTWLQPFLLLGQVC